jgi:ABC-type glycerol-3-phosphate transport system substrate-binding protein
MQGVEQKRVSRRRFVKLTTTAALAGPFFNFPDRTFASQKELRIAKWAHFVAEYDVWFAEMAKDWGKQHETQVTVDTIPPEQIWSRATAETKAGSGHDVFMFPWPPAEFLPHVIDHTEIYEKAAFKYGSIPQIAYKSTFFPKRKKHFAFADFWIPSPLHYFSDLWAEANMPLGPVHYGSLRSGGQRVRAKSGVPCGLSLSPTLEGNISLHTLFYAFRGQILGDDGTVVLNKTAFAVEALKYAKALNQDAGTPDELAWQPEGNVQAMLARKTSCTTNAISLLRAAENQHPDLARKIRLQPPLLGPYGVTAFPHVTNCSVVWNFAQNQDGAKQFVGDLIDNSRTSYEKSLGCNFPAYPKTIPNLIVRLENDAQANPADKYRNLKDALHWTPNLGAPGFANPVWMETFNSSVLPKMFSSFIKGELPAEDAAHAAEVEVKRIAEKWKDA